MRTPSKLFATCLAAACLGALAPAAQAVPAPAWEPIAASGPTNLPPVQDEVQKVAVDAGAGTYTLTANPAAGNGTLSFGSNFGNYSSGATAITFFSSAAAAGFAVGQTIVAGPGIQPETEVVAVSGSTITLSKSTTAGSGLFGSTVSAASKTVSGVTTDSGAFAVGQTISGAGIPTATTIAAVGADTLTLSAFPTQGGSQALTATATTAPVDFDAEASELEAALEAIGLEVSVTGGPGGPADEATTHPYSIVFDGAAFSGRDVPQMTADDSGLSGGVQGNVLVFTAVPGGPGTTQIAVFAQNVGGKSSSAAEPVTLAVDLPPGIVTDGDPHGGSDWSCTPGVGQQEVSCVTEEQDPGVFPVADPGFTLRQVAVPVRAEPGADSGMVEVEVSGGGVAVPATYEMPLVVSALPAPPGLQSFNAAPYKDDGTIDARAGAHPYSASSAILVNTVRSLRTGLVSPAGEFRDIVVDTPPGFFGNPIATEQCPEAVPAEECDQGSIVATAQIVLSALTNKAERSTVNNIAAPFGYPGKFRFRTGQNEVTINVAAGLRSDEDYGLEVGSFDTPQIKSVYGSFFTFWGSPLDEAHDEQRCREWNLFQEPLECVDAKDLEEKGLEPVAFLTNPLDCAEEAIRPPEARINVNTWQDPGLWFTNNVPLKPVEGCDELKFDADFKFEPSDTKSDSPASFRTELTVPSEGLLKPDKRMTPTIKKAEVELPEGVVLNASAADGLGACSEAQIGLKGTNFPAPNPMRFSKDPQTCPDNSKIGSGELKSDLIDEPLHGDLYLAAQGDGNPFGSLFAIYLVIEDPRHGIFVKLPAEVRVDEQTGQQKVVFPYTPPLPFSYLRLTLKGGDRSPLASPTTCGAYTTKSINTPWSYPESGPPTTSVNSFQINQGPNGLPCAPTPQARPFDVGLTAGTDSTGAGDFSPLVMRLTRPDGSQELDSFELKTAPGIAASLRGIPRCSDGAIAAAAGRTGKDEQVGSSCPADSQVGRLVTGAGSGPHPFYADGKLYLAGPYKGAPLSVVAITPAVAGPFDLGNVVVRTALYINRATAQVTAKTDPIPQILKGVPLRIRDVRAILDRKDFVLNPTSCEPSSIDVHAVGNSGAAKDLSSRFQVGGCGDLDFNPRFWSKVKGGTKRGRHPSFLAKVVWPEGPGFANTKDFQVTLPHSEFLDQAHIRTICTRVQALANACPAGSIYGFAVARTPLLDEPLSGPVFLKSSDHKLPDLAIKLRGPDSLPIEVEFAGRIDSIKGQIRNTIENLPDVPVSSFFLRMKGGKKGLLVNSRNLCKTRKVRVNIFATGQNNRRSHLRPLLHNSCRKVRKHKRHHKGHHHRRNRGKR